MNRVNTKKVKKLLVLTIIICFMLAGAALATAGESAAALPVPAANDFGFAPVMAITVICYLVAAMLKATTLDNKWLPVICGFVGGVLGVLAMYIGMEGFPAADLLTAIAIGIVSGLAATGINQIGKQLGGKTA